MIDRAVNADSSSAMQVREIRNLIGCGMVGKGLLKVERVCACFYAAGEDPGDAWSDG